MRIVVPYTALRPETYRAVADHDPRYVYMYDDYSYGHLLRELWGCGETFLLVEHDMAPTPAQIEQMAECESGYCCGVYPWTTTVGPALGFTRFRDRFLDAFPDAAEIACRIPSVYGQPGHWRQLDVFLQAAVLRDFYGVQPCCHLPPVEHLNKGQALLEVHSNRPPVSSVQGRTYLEPGTVERLAAEVAASR